MERVELKASIVIGIIGIILISFIYFKPVNIERDFGGYMYSEVSKFEESMEIKFIGVLKKKLSLNHVFTGTINVDGSKQQVSLKRIWAKNNIFKTIGYSSYIEIKNEKTGQYEVDGTIHTSKDFNEILIKLNRVDRKYNGKFNICGPSSTRIEAENIVLKLEQNK